MVTEAQVRQDFGLGADADGLLFVTSNDALSSEQLRGQSHYIRRAFDQMKLDGILCVDNIPTVYLKKFDRPVGREEVNVLHSKFWNQGTGTLLVILDPSFLFIFSSMVWPSKDSGEIKTHPALVETLDRVANTLEACQFVTRVASGQYYRDHSSEFKSYNSVDKHLLDNLGMFGKLLRREETAEECKRVHAFLGRIIFTCYLVDRGIIKLQNISFIKNKKITTLLGLLDTNLSRAKDRLYKLFYHLRDDFNGSMFETNLDEEKETISDDDIEILIRFLRGDELSRGQQTLGFWAYDFSVIPVETISAIYERFLEEEDVVEKDQQGAFYTPRHLAEMVVNEATSNFDTLLGKRCLDPACGSGIFLVILFNRIAEEIFKENPRAHQRTRVNKLLDVLENQICGVDVNKTACRITCFSLYIAFLDQFDPPTLIELQKKSNKSGQILPKLLAYKDCQYQNTVTPVIYEGNFFDSALPVRDDFDIVVGNPPWVSRNNQSSENDVEKWVYSERNNPFLTEAPRAKNERKKIFLYQDQIALAFMWKILLHVCESGHISMLLPIHVLLGKTNEFQNAWFSKAEVSRIVNLSDFRWFLFQDATRPATIIHFGFPSSERNVENIEYIVPKVRQQDPRLGIVRVFPNDRKWVKTADILNASRPQKGTDDKELTSDAAIFWKSLFWGTPRDVAFIEYLRSLDCLNDIAGDRRKDKRWLKGTGFQPWYQASYDADPKYGEKTPIPGDLNDPLLSTVKELQMFVLPEDTIPLGEHLKSLKCPGHPPETPREKLTASLEGFHRSRDERLYEPPMVLINKGFSKFVFVDFKTFYRDSLTGISADRSDEALLRFLVVFVKSKLAKYFIFHTASNLGTERDQVFVHELMRLPFPLPESRDSHEDAESIIEEIAEKMKRLQLDIADEYENARNRSDFALVSQTLQESRKIRIEQLQADFEPLVYRYFKLTKQEITLVEDTCDIICNSATPFSPGEPIPTTQPTSMVDRRQYSKCLCDTLNKWSKSDQPKGRNQPFYFRAEVIPFPNVGMNLLTLYQAKKRVPPVEAAANDQLVRIVAQLNNSAAYMRGSFQYLRGVIFGDGNAIHIFKPDMLGQWMKTSALDDADQIFHAIIQSKRQ